MEKEDDDMDAAPVQGTPLFRDMEPASIDRALSALFAQERRYRKQDLILGVGTITDRIGIVLEGSVTIESRDVWGNRTILGSIGPKNAFAESYALLENEPLLVDVRANEDCRVLFLRVGALGRLAKERQPWAIALENNLLMDSARKNLMLSRKSFFTAPKGIRARVMAYLHSQNGPVNQYLSATDWKSEKIGTLPVRVDHKIRINGAINNDVGYVYAKKPFVLAIFTNGWSNDQIAAVAQKIYDLAE